MAAVFGLAEFRVEWAKAWGIWDDLGFRGSGLRGFRNGPPRSCSEVVEPGFRA